MYTEPKMKWNIIPNQIMCSEIVYSSMFHRSLTIPFFTTIGDRSRTSSVSAAHVPTEHGPVTPASQAAPWQASRMCPAQHLSLRTVSCSVNRHLPLTLFVQPNSVGAACQYICGPILEQLESDTLYQSWCVYLSVHVPLRLGHDVFFLRQLYTPHYLFVLLISTVSATDLSAR
jgi:hypothetical protein